MHRFAVPLLACLLALAGCAAGPGVERHVPLVEHSQPGTLALLGATGMTGGYLLDKALALGYRVRVLARTPEKLAAYRGRIDIVAGDARNEEALAQLVAGADVVVSAIGPTGRGGAGLNSTVTASLLAVMPAAGVSHYVVISGAGVVAPTDQRDLRGHFVRWLAQLRYRSLLADRQREYALLEASAIDWTVWRCPVILDQAYRQAPLVSLLTTPGFRVRAGELAALVFDALDTGRYQRAAPFVASGG